MSEKIRYLIIRERISLKKLEHPFINLIKINYWLLHNNKGFVQDELIKRFLTYLQKRLNGSRKIVKILSDALIFKTTFSFKWEKEWPEKEKDEY